MWEQEMKPLVRRTRLSLSPSVKVLRLTASQGSRWSGPNACWSSALLARLNQKSSGSRSVLRQQHGEKLSCRYEGNPKQPTDQPTAIRWLTVFRPLNRVQLVAGQRSVYLTPLSPLQPQIRALVARSDTLYETSFQNSEEFHRNYAKGK